MSGLSMDVTLTIDIAIARRMLCVAGYSREEVYSASDYEVFKKVLGMIDCYGVTFTVKEI